MNINELTSVFKHAAEVVHGKEKFVTAGLAVRASKAHENYPTDGALATCAAILNQMQNTKPFITRAELNSLYDKLYNGSTHLGEIFATELDRGEVLQGAKHYDKYKSEMINEFQAVGDPVLANALSAVFDKSNEYKVYSPKTAQLAEKICNAGLMEIGLAPKKIDTFAGREDIILCRASYETPKGMCNVIVPIEIKEGRALLPTMFLGTDSFVDLQENLLKSHIISTAGKSYTVDGEQLLNVFSMAKNGIKKAASEVELAVIRMRTQKNAGSVFHDPNGIVGMRVTDPVRDVKDIEMPKTAEHNEFSKRVSSQDGVARFVHGDKAVEAGRSVIARKMAEYGYKNVQVKVLEAKDDKIQYAVGVGTGAGLTVSLAVSKGNVGTPKFAVASGKIKAFDKSGIDELVKATKADNRAIAASSMCAGMRPEQLIQQVKDAVEEGNLLKAEDAINVLGETDKTAQRIALAILMQGLRQPGAAEENHIDKTASKKFLETPLFNTYNIFFPQDTK